MLTSCLVIVVSFSVPVASVAAVSDNGGFIVLQDETDSRLIAAGETLKKYMEQITEVRFLFLLRERV